MVENHFTDNLYQLLKRGASVHARNRAGNTPLFLARKAGAVEVIKVLEEAGGHLWVEERSSV